MTKGAGPHYVGLNTNKDIENSLDGYINSINNPQRGHTFEVLINLVLG